MNPAIFSINIPEKNAGTHTGFIRDTASKAVKGANKITLKPLYAAYINNRSGKKIKIISMNNILKLLPILSQYETGITAT